LTLRKDNGFISETQRIVLLYLHMALLVEQKKEFLRAAA
jgi:hypothetical protein